MQYGFRSGRSTSDFVFMLLSAIRKPKKKRHTVSIAFCHIAKAYDWVNCELLYTKLDTLGFGGKVSKQPMYYNGFEGAPMLHQRSEAGVRPITNSCTCRMITCHEGRYKLQWPSNICIVLCGQSGSHLTDSERYMEKMLRFSNGMHMKLSIEMTVILSSGPKGQAWKVEQGTPDLEAVLVVEFNPECFVCRQSCVSKLM